MLELGEQQGVDCQLEALLALSHYSRLIDLKSPWRGSDLFPGANASRIKGSGLDFAELKNYQVGDDVRHMDWKKSHSSGRPHVRLFEEDKEQKVSLLIDQSPAMFFASQGQTKSAFAAQLASLIAWRLLADSDQLAINILSPKQPNCRQFELYSGPFSRSKASLIAGLERLARATQVLSRENTHSSPASFLNQGLEALLNRQGLGQVCYIISDFNGLDDKLINLIKQCSVQAQIRLLFIVDPLERMLPGVDSLVASDGLRQISIDGSNGRFRQAYQQQFQKKCQCLIELQQTASFQAKALAVFNLDNSRALLPQMLALTAGDKAGEFSRV